MTSPTFLLRVMVCLLCLASPNALSLVGASGGVSFAATNVDDPLLKEAERLFLEGQTLARKARYKDALAKFLASYRIVPSKTTSRHQKIRSTLLFLIGRTYQLQKQFADAGLYYRKYLKVGKRKRFRTLAQRFLKKLWPYLKATLQVQAAEGQSTEGLSCQLQEPRGSFELALPGNKEVEAGEIVVSCSMTGFLPYRRKLNIAAGQTQTLLIKLSPAPTQRPNPPTTGGPRDLRWVAFLVGGLGLATVGVGGVFGGLSLAARSSGEEAILQAEQSGLATDTRKVLAADQEAQQHATTANVMFAVGGGVAIVGVILYFVLRPRKPSPRTQSRSSGAKVCMNCRMHSDETWSFSSSSDFSIVVSP